MENKTTKGGPEDIAVVGGQVVPTGETIEIPPETAIRIENGSKSEYLILQMIGEGYISEADAQKLKEKEEAKRKDKMNKDIEKATKGYNEKQNKQQSKGR